jgi:hypothetical protein
LVAARDPEIGRLFRIGAELDERQAVALARQVEASTRARRGFGEGVG